VCAGSKIKLQAEPYKDYFLDLLDMVLLGCLFAISVSSFVFNKAIVAAALTNPSSTTVLFCWVSELPPGAWRGARGRKLCAY
jgi:hypothetical protein